MPPRQRLTASPPLLAAILTLLATVPFAAGQTDSTIGLELVAAGFERPIGVVAHGAALYVLEQGGTVRVVRDAAVLPTPFLDLRGLVSAGGERGLLGLAFPPGAAAAPGQALDQEPEEVFVHYSGAGGDTVVARMPVRGGLARPAEAATVLRQAQPYPNHNGGQLAFGPDGMLYLGLGDGGGGGDPLRAGQNLETWLGKILRLDVTVAPYRIPPDNPYAGGGGLPEIWASGLRNPWRFSFDRTTGALWIADVGQNRSEEIDRLAADAPPGADFGWSTLEGNRCFREDPCDREGTVLPIAVYDHGDGLGRSVTGGYVYRGDGLPALRGRYVFGDFVGGTILVVDAEPAAADATRVNGAEPVRPELLARPGFPVSSFGLDSNGELLLLDYGAGRLLRIVPP